MDDDAPLLVAVPLVRRTPYADPTADDEEIWEWTLWFTRVVGVLAVPAVVAGLALLAAPGAGPLSVLGNAVGFGLATIPLSTVLVGRGALIVLYPGRAVGSRIGERLGTVSSEDEAVLNGVTMVAVGLALPVALLFVVTG